MKKDKKVATGLKLKSTKVLILSPNHMEQVAAGDDNSFQTAPKSSECVPPFNAPPFYYPTK